MAGCGQAAVRACLHTSTCVCVWLCAHPDQAETAKRGINLQKQAAGAGMLSDFLNTPIQMSALVKQIE